MDRKLDKKPEKVSIKKDKIKRQLCVDLCYVETQVIDISACICVRYDAGICRHKLERTGVLVEYE